MEKKLYTTVMGLLVLPRGPLKNNISKDKENHLHAKIFEPQN